MPAPTKVSRVGPATKGEKEWFQSHWNMKKWKCSWQELYWLDCVSVAQDYTEDKQQSWDLNLAPCLALRLTHHARALFRDLVLFLKYSAYWEELVHFTVYWAPFCKTFTVELLHCHRLWGTWHTEEVILNYSFSDTQACPQQACKTQQQPILWTLCCTLPHGGPA